jgi:hypothetical protein
MKFLLFISVFSIPYVFTSCSNILGQDTMLKFLPENIESFGDFIKAWMVIAIAQFIVVLFISLVFSCGVGFPNFIVGIVYFIVIYTSKDYGFWMIVLLFFTSTIIGWFLSFILINIFGIKSIRR